MTVSYIGRREVVRKALTPEPDGMIRVWDGAVVAIVRPVGPIRWNKSGKDWRGDREVER